MSEQTIGKRMVKVLFFTLVSILSLIGLATIILGIWFFTTDPLHMFDKRTDVSPVSSDTATTTFDHPYLSPEQEEQLQQYGFDIQKLPTNITPELQACAIEKLGASRVEALRAGAKPTATDFFRARGCLELK